MYIYIYIYTFLICSLQYNSASAIEQQLTAMCFSSYEQNSQQ